MTPLDIARDEWPALAWEQRAFECIESEAIHGTHSRVSAYRFTDGSVWCAYATVGSTTYIVEKKDLRSALRELRRRLA